MSASPIRAARRRLRVAGLPSPTVDELWFHAPELAWRSLPAAHPSRHE